MPVRGIRGATTAATNSREAILEATSELLECLVRTNGVRREDVASILFSTTPDLNAEFPAVAARTAGWTDVALLCTHEMSVPGSLQRCVRILIHVNTDRPPSEMEHIYLRGARALRPDLAVAPESRAPEEPS